LAVDAARADSSSADSTPPHKRSEFAVDGKGLQQDGYSDATFYNWKKYGRLGFVVEAAGGGELRFRFAQMLGRRSAHA
jgi:hypothetical protein